MQLGSILPAISDEDEVWENSIFSHTFREAGGLIQGFFENAVTRLEKIISNYHV